MQILNAKASTLVFKLDNGQVMQVQTGQTSQPFLASIYQIQSIINLGTPEEIGIIISSSYELDLMRQLNGSIAYLHNSEAEARKRLLEGKSAEEAAIPAEVNVEAEKMKAELNDKNKEIKVLQDKIKELESQLEASPAVELRNQLKVANEELVKTKSTYQELYEKYEQLNTTLSEKEKELKQVQMDKAQADQMLVEANNKLTSAVTSENEKVNDLNTKLQEAETRIKELEGATPQVVGVPQETHDATLAELETAKNEITQLKEDGAKIVENYKKAKDALVAVMEQFHIRYTGTEYVQDQV
jgi:DNA repair exonuclease SbcCD ATPase subunit